MIRQGGGPDFATVIWTIWFAWAAFRAFQVGPPPENYVKPGKLPFVAVWNLFDEDRWTDEGIAYHRSVLKFTAEALAVFLAGQLLLAFMG